MPVANDAMSDLERRQASIGAGYQCIHVLRSGIWQHTLRLDGSESAYSTVKKKKKKLQRAGTRRNKHEWRNDSTPES